MKYVSSTDGQQELDDAKAKAQVSFMRCSKYKTNGFALLQGLWAKYCGCLGGA